MFVNGFENLGLASLGPDGFTVDLGSQRGRTVSRRGPTIVEAGSDTHHCALGQLAVPHPKYPRVLIAVLRPALMWVVQYQKVHPIQVWESTGDSSDPSWGYDIYNWNIQNLCHLLQAAHLDRTSRSSYHRPHLQVTRHPGRTIDLLCFSFIFQLVLRCNWRGELRGLQFLHGHVFWYLGTFQPRIETVHLLELCYNALLYCPLDSTKGHVDVMSWWCGKKCDRSVGTCTAIIFAADPQIQGVLG